MMKSPPQICNSLLPLLWIIRLFFIDTLWHFEWFVGHVLNRIVKKSNASHVVLDFLLITFLICLNDIAECNPG